jgi:hypothetical protein
MTNASMFTFRTARRIVTVTALAALASTSAAAVAATTAGASGSYMTTTWTPQSSPSQPAPGWITPAVRNSVTMQCWTTGPVKLNTGKCFYIIDNAYPYTRGYVPANAVGAQTVVLHCA